jgi:hypothetical protein
MQFDIHSSKQTNIDFLSENNLSKFRFNLKRLCLHLFLAMSVEAQVPVVLTAYGIFPPMPNVNILGKT